MPYEQKSQRGFLDSLPRAGGVLGSDMQGGAGRGGTASPVQAGPIRKGQPLGLIRKGQPLGLIRKGQPIDLIRNSLPRADGGASVRQSSYSSASSS
uniref:hypothetical protein n=1 Tax=Curtanaerobium respiraculi TaxID=2949669 RepID=UPI0024B37DD0|nr:hypothetical protein [Curtanaerobium respiraculi]